MAREASIQLTLQNALVLYQYIRPPVLELYYQSSYFPTVNWMFDVALLFISTLLSANSTFGPILMNVELRYYQKYQKPPHLFVYLVKVLQVMPRDDSIKRNLYILFLVDIKFLYWNLAGPEGISYKNCKF